MKFEDFIEQKSELGNFDSTGQFTISSYKAIDKTSAYALVNPKHWLLKVIQAAVALECDEVQVRLTRKNIRVELWGGTLISLKDFPDHLASPVRPTTDAGSELYLGLKSLLNHSHFAIKDSNGHKFRWNGDRLEEDASERQKPAANLLLWVSREHRFEGWIKSSRKRASESVNYQQLLRERALFAPLKLLCDGREITPKSALTEDLLPRQDSEAWASPIHLMAAAINDGENIMSVAKPGVAKDALRCREPFLDVAPKEGKPKLQFHLFLSYKLRSSETGGAKTETLSAPCFVHFGRLGIICETRKAISLSCGSVSYYELGAESGDLSGLKLSSNRGDWDRYIEIAKKLEPRFTNLCEEMRKHSTRLHYYRPTKEHRYNNVGTGALISAFVSPAFLVAGAKCLVLGPAAILGGAFVGMALPYCNISKLSKEDLEAWSWAVENFSLSDEWKSQIRYEMID